MTGTPLWALDSGLDLSPLEGVAEADVCVVGLGGSGLACANELARAGVRVIGIDAGEVGSGAAGRNGGFLLAGVARFYHDAVTSYGHARARRMYELTLDEIDRISGEPGSGVTRPGSLRIAESAEERHDCEAQLDAMRADGFPAERYEGPEGTGFIVHGDGAFQPLARCRALARQAMERGVALHEGSTATRVEPGIVHTANGEVRATTIVVAVDGALDRLLPELKGEVRTARLQMLATAPTREVVIPRPVYARWGYDYWQQRPDGAIALGGARDIGGDAEWTHDTTPTAAVQDALERRLRDILGVAAPITHRWGASVSYTSDELPVARIVRPGVWALGAYSGTGNVVGSLLGRGIARLIAHGNDELIAPFQAVAPSEARSVHVQSGP